MILSSFLSASAYLKRSEQRLFKLTMALCSKLLTFFDVRVASQGQALVDTGS